MAKARVSIEGEGRTLEAFWDAAA
ncbi:hypothetical protein HaLaN_14462, partial [Haematococcus lacustris]